MSKSVVRVSCHGNRGTVDPRTVRRRGERILKAASADGVELSILLCDDVFIRDLNRTYREMDKPTDVLSFSMKEGEKLGSSPELLGDVIISVETAVRQAKQAGCTPIEEVTSLLIHGVLHLLGYEHHKSKDEKRMLGEAQRIAREI
jgi:probable rRNA maturation factor